MLLGEASPEFLMQIKSSTHRKRRIRTHSPVRFLNFNPIISLHVQWSVEQFAQNRHPRVVVQRERRSGREAKHAHLQIEQPPDQICRIHVLVLINRSRTHVHLVTCKHTCVKTFGLTEKSSHSCTCMYVIFDTSCELISSFGNLGLDGGDPGPNSSIPTSTASTDPAARRKTPIF